MFANAIASVVNASLENPAMSLTDPSTWDDIFSGSEAASGERITHTSSLKSAPVWQGVSVISGDLASIPIHIRRIETEGANKGDAEIDTTHAVEYLISVQPNDEMSAVDLWRRLFVHALLWNNGYLFIERKGRAASGKILSLANLLPDRTYSTRDEHGNLFYVTEIDGRLEPLLPHEVYHLKGISIDTSGGLDMVENARDAIGLALAAQNFGSRFFANGAQAGGVLEVPADFSAKATHNLEVKFGKQYSGRNNWFKTIVLRDGAKFHQTMLDAEKSQMHELREDQIREIARYFNLPPFKLGAKETVQYKSVEDQQLVYHTGTLTHWLSAIKGEATIKFLTSPQKKRRTHGVWHDVKTLISLDAKTQNTLLDTQRKSLVITGNEWRREIGRNRSSDPLADKLINPNTLSNDESKPDDKDVPDDTSEDTDGTTPDQDAQNIRELIIQDAEYAANAGHAEYGGWVDEPFSQYLMFEDVDLSRYNLLSVYVETLHDLFRSTLDAPLDSLLSTVAEACLNARKIPTGFEE